MKSILRQEEGPFTVDQIRPGDRYELSHGHPVICEPTGDEGSQASAAGVRVISTDPKVEAVGVDTGYALDRKTLRAPDIAVGALTNRPGWAQGAPTLAIEYAGVGQDEDELQWKIADLQEAGTKHIWIVRLTGPRRVEVYRRGEPMRVYKPGQTIVAEDVLQNPVLVESLYDPEVSKQHALRNLLQRQGFGGLDDVLEKGRNEGRAEGTVEGRRQGRFDALRAALGQILSARQFESDAATCERIAACADEQLLLTWIRRAATAESLSDVFA